MAQTDNQTGNHNGTTDLKTCDCRDKGVVFDAEQVRERLLDVEKEIAPCKPRIIGVTKYYGLDSIIKGYQAGLRDFGESRALEAINKIESLPADIKMNSNFHFIGHLQTNKAEKVVRHFDYIHSVDSLRLAETISKHAEDNGKRIKVLLQVNNAGEEQKYGYSKTGLENDIREIISLTGIEVIGLMNIAPLGANETTLRYLFKDMLKFKQKLEQSYKIKLNELSMGMSDDYKIAVQEGATMIRIGRKLFTN